MNKLVFRYQLEERPPLTELLIFGLQWFLIVVPYIIILGSITGGIQYPDSPALRLMYLQKLFVITGGTLLFQIIAGHRLPLIIGPAVVLLSGIAVNQAQSDAAYFSIAVCGLLLSVLSALKLLNKVSSLFTPRVIGVVLLLIAFTILPTILNLITAGSPAPFTQLVFAFTLITAMTIGQRFLPGAIKSTIVIWGMLFGSTAYYLLINGTWPHITIEQTTAEWQDLLIAFDFNPVVAISFLFCFLALTANDLGSIQSTASLLELKDADRRSNRGLIVTGLGNLFAGLTGVIGPVNYSFSSGVIIATSCASRYPLLVAAIGMLILAIIPGVIGVFSYVPAVVTGSLIFYTMCSQIAGGLMVLSKPLADSGFETGIIIGFSLMIGTIVAFLPVNVTSTIPMAIRPLLTNGFVVGVTAALILEHVVYTKGR